MGVVNPSYENLIVSSGFPTTGKSIHFERHMTAPEIQLVLTVGLDPRGYFLGGENIFKLAIWL